MGSGHSDEVRQDDGSHRLYDDGRAQGEASVVAAGDLQGRHLALGEIVRLLGLGDTGSRLEGYAEHQRVAVGDAAVHAAGVIRGGRHQAIAVVAAAAAFMVAFAAVTTTAFVVMLFTTVAATFAFTVFVAAAFVIGAMFMAAAVSMAAAACGSIDIIVLGTLHPGGGEAVAEFHAADAGNGEEGVREAGFHAVPEGLAEPGGDAGNDALHDAAERIALFLRLVQSGVPLRRVGDSADFDEAGVTAELDAAKSSFFAMTPAATTGSVRRPEKWPPPRGSWKPPYLRFAV